MRDQGPFQFWSEVRQGGHEAHKHRGVKRRNRFPGVPQWTTTAGFHGLTPDLATGGGLGALRATHLPYLQQEEYLAPILAEVIILPSESAGHSRSDGSIITSAKIDRKSTRLNSSHVSISYAVFCLKKKNQHT